MGSIPFHVVLVDHIDVVTELHCDQFIFGSGNFHIISAYCTGIIERFIKEVNFSVVVIILFLYTDILLVLCILYD